MAPVQPFEDFDAKTQSIVRQQAHLALMPLPARAAIPESCVDLRLINPFPRDVVLAFTRIASLSDEGRHRLQTAIIAFFVQRELPTAPAGLP